MAKRAQKANSQQINLMLDFFQTNKGLAEGKFSAMNGKVEANKKWVEMEQLLNSVLGGAHKTASQWQVVWRDLKSRTSIKARDLRNERCQTGNKPLTHTALTEAEKRVIEIIGLEYCEGSKDCFDSIPEEEYLQLSVEQGDDSVLLKSPRNTCDQEEVTEETPVKRRKRVEQEPSYSSSRKKQSRVDVFAQIAKQQADASTLQAEASKQHAEALHLQAQAFDRFVSAFENYFEYVKQTSCSGLNLI